MVNYADIMVALREQIARLRDEGTAQRLPSLGDHDYIVGTIAGVELALQTIDTIRKQEEDFDSDDEEFT